MVCFCKQEYQKRKDSRQYKHGKAKDLNKRKWRNYEECFKYLLDHPCIDCGESNPVVLDFDHVKGKRKNISQMKRSHTWENILDEIELCVVRCANCHRMKTAKEMESITWRLYCASRKENS